LIPIVLDSVTIPSDDELALRTWLWEFSTTRPRWGWRRAASQAREEGWRVNDKHIHRLLREEGLRIPYKKRKKPIRGLGVLTGQMCPIAPNAIWAADFQFDQTANGRTLKILNVIDEFTMEALATEVDRSIDADHVVRVLDKIAGERGYPEYLRFDNRPEFVAFAIADWCRFNAVQTIFIERDHRGKTPGSSPSTAECATST